MISTIGRIVVFGAALVMAAAPTAQATQARIDSMGGGPRYITVEDEVNIFEFPSLLVRYGNMAYVDNLDVDLVNTRFGFHYTIVEGVVIAIYGGRVNGTTRPVGSANRNGTGNNTTGFQSAGNVFTSDPNLFGGAALSVGGQASMAGNANNGNFGPNGPGGTPSTVTQNGGDAINNVDLKMGLLFAAQLGSTVRLGAMVNILGDDGDTEQPNTAKTDFGATLIDIALGLGIDLVGAELEIGLGVEFGLLEDFRDGFFANTPPGQPQQQGELIEHWAASHFGLRIAGRFTADLFDTHKLVAYARLGFGTQEVSHNNAVFPAAVGATPIPGGEWSNIELILGADLRLELFDDVIVAPGIGMRWSQQTLAGGGVTERDVDRILSLPYYGVGVDVKVFEWLDFRFGANQYIDFYRRSQTAGGATVENRESDVETVVATGLGFNIPIAKDANPQDPSMLRLDINVNPLFWLNGPDFITGNATTTPFEGSAGRFGLTAAIQYDW